MKLLALQQFSLGLQYCVEKKAQKPDNKSARFLFYSSNWEGKTETEGCFCPLPHSRSSECRISPCAAQPPAWHEARHHGCGARAAPAGCLSPRWRRDPAAHQSPATKLPTTTPWCWPQPPVLRYARLENLHQLLRAAAQLPSTPRYSLDVGDSTFPSFCCGKTTSKCHMVRKVIRFAITQLQLLLEQMGFNSRCTSGCGVRGTTVQTKMPQPERDDWPCYQPHSYRCRRFSCYRRIPFTAHFTEEINLQCKMLAANLISKKNEEQKNGKIFL